jgi:Flp pilus assembly protein TadD
VRLDPSLTSSYFGLARIYNREGKFPEALAALEVAEKQEPENSSIHYLKGQVLLRLGRQKEGREELAASNKLMAARREEQRRRVESQENIPDPELLPH